MPRTLYHVTRAAHLPAILEEGLRPAIGPRSQLLGEREPAIYAFPDRLGVEDGLTNWLGSQFDEDDALVILAFQINESTPLVELPGTFEVVLLSPVPAESIIAIFDESWQAQAPDAFTPAVRRPPWPSSSL